MGETLRKTYQTPFCQPWNPKGVTKIQTRDPSGARWASNHLYHGVTYLHFLPYHSWLQTSWGWRFETKLMVLENFTEGTAFDFSLGPHNFSFGIKFIFKHCDLSKLSVVKCNEHNVAPGLEIKFSLLQYANYTLNRRLFGWGNLWKDKTFFHLHFFCVEVQHSYSLQEGVFA